MPTADRRSFVPDAIRYFLAQDYPEKELVIVDDGADSVADLVPDDPRIRYFRSERRQLIGAKRNFACRAARGDVVVHCDDDDWSAPWRLRYQVEQLQAAGADICGLNRVWFYAREEKRAWEYVYPSRQKPWVYGASLCYTREFWLRHPFPEIRLGEDTRFVWADARARVHALADSRFLVALIHGKNTSRKRTADSRYQPREIAEIERLLGENEADFPPPDPAPSMKSKPRALISAALGIGDILRVTPLIRVAHRLGYVVDVLLATDYPEAARLLEGAPEIRRVFQVPSARCRDGVTMVDGLADSEYDVAAFTTWSAPLRKRVRSRRALAFDRARWLKEGDSRSVDRLARELGWDGPMPEPFALASARRFDLLPGTIALHPGCKVEWPWKKWHGFDELAGKFPSVVLVGSEEDLRSDGTYFRRDFAWPEHVQNFIGKLTLPDTAALLRACAALVSNDSGLMQLAVALEVPTFGIFGITSPVREAMRSKHFHAITKKLPCEAACHAGTWGRRDCDRHLECLKTLTADEVFMKVTELLPETACAPELSRPRAAVQAIPADNAKSKRPHPHETINLVYHAAVFDASGYGQAARAYIHALHDAGVNVAVVDLANHARQVPDKLVESLAGRTIDPDFHLFHGIPPLWARRAFPLRHVIAMTVWETDAMPPQWRPALNHALDVWLPCEFNVSVFERALGKPVFKLPHAWAPNEATPAADLIPASGAIREEDFVFYSIFEWQERKGPNEMIEAFLRAFPEPAPVILALKTNPGAAHVAATTLANLRRCIRSQARVELRPEAWSEEQMAAFQERGDCYVSLHRGEGWNYPLFEAAGRGKAIVATDFSGPTEYLDPAAHRLVRHRPAPVRQRYAFYSTAMHWAEPEMEHAIDQLRAAFAARGQNDFSAKVAERIRRDFSSDAVGETARQRLMQLLRRTNHAKWERFDRSERQEVLAPAVPIPGEWYDADYFERGRKSNWREGYTWQAFAQLFRDTAEFLTTTFPEAETYLDAGCGKGFLVRTLRERGKEAWGFDHSPWAIEHAEESAKPFLQLCDVTTASFDEREYDVVLVFFLLESLSEEQALSFLERARAKTRQALVAVVPTCENQEQAARLLEEDRDLSHITLRSRAWWHQLFQRAGWRQDSLHRIVEQTCQRHPLPGKMEWQMFVYASS